MDRSISSDGREPGSAGQMARDIPPSRQLEPREKPTSDRDRPSVARKEREYQITESERESLTQIGRFRTLSVGDLARYQYAGNTAKMGQDLRHLISQRLLRSQTIWLGKNKEMLTVAALTKRGKSLLEKSGETSTLYAGFVKPAEMRHDAAIYGMYQAEAARISTSGGQIRRLTLDYELKRNVYSLLAKEKPGTAVYKKRQAEIASEHGLKVVRGHIQLPDLRIEYQSRNGEIAHRDLELATNHYRGGQLAAKADAGFTFYASAADATRLSSVFDDHHITAEILSL